MWATIAEKLVKPSGILAFSLFPPLVRPTATAERQKILEFVSSIGDVEIVEDALVYETPLFEKEALRAAGVEDTGNWRRGDLVLVRVRRASRIEKEQPLLGSHTRLKWRTLVVSGQVVKIRLQRQGKHGPSEPISNVGSLPSFVYPTVSARDALRDQIDLWTSRNRVARVDDLELVTTVLARMQHGASLREGMRSVGPTRTRCRISQTVEQSIREVLGGST
jgi:hypothetical protein